MSPTQLGMFHKNLAPWRTEAFPEMKRFSRRTCETRGGSQLPRDMKLRTFLPISIFLAMFSFSSGAPLKQGDSAPLVGGVIDDGTTLNLGDVYKKNNYTLVWFYPAALTGGCTAQGCSLRDAAADLTKKGVAVVGVSTDTVAKQKEFKDKNNFPFPLIADTEKKVGKAFGQAETGRASREAYLIDRSGKIVYYDKGQTDKQAEMVLAFLNAQKN
jgi:thioredoxin-dependent peroxiredoxin